MNDYPCGSESWKGRIPFLFRLHVPQFCFRSACEWHDLMYARGGTPETRLDVDRMFKWMMDSRINEKYQIASRGRKAIARWYLLFWSWVFYRAVRQYGSAHFNYQMRVSDE